MSVDLGDRFWSKVNKTPTCWVWTAGHTSNGYGTFAIGYGHQLAHRLTYQACVGPIPNGKELDHLCRVRDCVNPQHLEPVTRRENVRRGIGPTAKNMQKTHCPRGHAYTAGNTYLGKDGGRDCRVCTLARQQAYRAAATAARSVPGEWLRP